MTGNQIAQRLASHFGYSQNIVLPNYSNGLVGWEADLVVVRPSGWAEEIEVKVSLADYRAEFKNKGMKHRILQCGNPLVIHKPWATRAFAEAHGHPTDEHDTWDEAYDADGVDHLVRHPNIVYGLKDWRKCSPHFCKRYWFAMPAELADKLKDEIPEYAGLFAVEPCKWDNGRIKEIIKAPNLKNAQKVRNETITHILKCAYYRMWEFEKGYRKPKIEAAA